MSELFWEASVDEMITGYKYDASSGMYVCLICHEPFEKGVLYEYGNTYLEAWKAAEQHIADRHESMFQALIQMDKKYTGLSELQKNLLLSFFSGASDKETAKELGIGSTSTIRNHRFKLKEKQKQAKVFLALMEMLQVKGSRKQHELVSIHKGATMVDERYAITEEEKEKAIKAYFKQGEDGPLHQFPGKEKKKIIVLQHLIGRFEERRIYSEKEVNSILKDAYDDFATLRRYFIEYGFMERNRDCSEYWLT